MKKKLQISSNRGGVRIIVRVEDESGEDERREYRNLTWSTLSRIDHLTYRSKHKVTTVMSPSGIDIFIQERTNG